MLISISCVSCGTTGEIPSRYLGKSIRCKTCREDFIATQAPEPAASRKEVIMEDMPSVLVETQEFVAPINA